MLVLALTAGATAAAIVAWMADRRRSRRRNERGECGACGASWADSGDPYLIHGRLVCRVCAERARKRMPWELAGLAGWAALVAPVGAVNVLVGNVAGMALLVIPPTILVPWGTVRLMKRANRRAQRRIAAGEFPGLGESGTVGAASLTVGRYTVGAPGRNRRMARSVEPR